MTNWENMTPKDEQRILDNAYKLQADPRDPDQIIRDLRDRIEELEPSLADWKAMAMKAQARVEELGKRIKVQGDANHELWVERDRYRHALEEIAAMDERYWTGTMIAQEALNPK